MWVLIAMTAEKCFQIFYPIKAKTWCTVKSAKIVCGIIIVLWAVYESQWFFLAKVIDDGFYKFCYFDYTMASEKYFEFYLFFESFCYSFIPCALLLILNSSIIIKLIKAKVKVGRDGDMSQNSLSKTTVSTLIMLLSVSLAFMFLTIPPQVTWVLKELKFEISPFVQEMTMMCYYLNHSLNAVLYTVVGPKFRREMLKMMFPCKKKVGANSSVRTNTSNEAM